jgi:hypothetical protein
VVALYSLENYGDRVGNAVFVIKPFTACDRSKFKGEITGGNFHISRILETSKCDCAPTEVPDRSN